MRAQLASVKAAVRAAQSTSVRLFGRALACEQVGGSVAS
eukprot:gene9783-5152_t